MKSRRTLLAVVLVTGAGSMAMSWFMAQHSESGARWRFLVLIACWVPLWLVGAWAARRLPARTSLVVVVLLAALLRTCSTPVTRAGARGRSPVGSSTTV